MTDRAQIRPEIDTEWLVNQIAHALRNPIFAATVQADTITLRSPPDSALARPAWILAEQLARLETTIQEMLLLGRPARVAPRQVVLPRLLDELAAAYAAGHRGETAEVVVTTADPNLELETDPDLLRLVLERLIDNAAQHSEPPHRVELEATATGNAVRLVIADHGAGMTAEILGQATLPFYPQHRGRPGLGLAIAAKMVTALGGRLDISSGEGQGTRVTIELPVSVAGAQ